MPTGPITVLLFEDDDSQALLTREALEQAECAVDVCRTGREGLEKLFAREYDVYLVDIKLPDINGVELLRRIIAVKPSAVVIVVTGHGDENAAVEAMKTGAYDYIVKSPSMGHLAALPFVIREGTGRSRLKLEREELQSEIWEHARLLEERNAELRRMRREVKRLNEWKKCVSAGWTPRLKQALERLLEKTSDATPPDTADKALGKAVALLDDLIRQEIAPIQLNKAFMDPAQFVHAEIDALRTGLSGRNVKNDLRIEEPSACVFVDGERMRQVIRTLFSYVVGSIVEQGGICFSWRRVQAESVECRLAFSPDGTFTDAAAADAALSPWPENGSGMAYAKQLIELHGGQVWLSSPNGRSRGEIGFTLPFTSRMQAFAEYVERNIEAAQQGQQDFSVIALQVDIESLGQTCPEGETKKFLATVAERLQEIVRQRRGDYVVRGPDDSMMLVLAQVGQAGASVIAERIKRVLEGQPWRLGPKSIDVEFRTGIATYPRDGDTAEELLLVAEKRVRVPANASGQQVNPA